MNDFENKFLALLHDVHPISKEQFKNDVAGTKAFIVSTGWRTSLYWVFKLKWTGTKIKKPDDITRDVIKAYEAHGRLMYSVLLLCEEAHPFRSKDWEEYDSWLDWFISIVAEAVKESHNLQEKSKTRKLQEQRECLKLLHDFINPYDDETEPHFWRLIETWTTKLAKIPNLEKQYWNPFKRCLSKWITERSSTRWGCLFEEKTESQLTLKSTQGRGHRYLNLAHTVTIKIKN